MRTLITLILLTATLVCAQSMSIQRGHSGGGYSDGPSLIVEPPAQITAGEDLRMYELVSSLYTNKTKLNSSLRVTVTHADKIAQQPDVLCARYTPDLIRELYSLRASFVGLMNRVAYDTADRRIEGMPNRVDIGYGRSRKNVFKKSERDKENIEHRAEQSAVAQLKRLLASRFTVKTYGMTDRTTHHYKLDDGEYLLCVLQRVNNPDAKAMLGSKWAIWWTRFTVEADKPKALVLNETNAISWREIFEVD